ncbi:MAG: transglycosylase, partial [Caulobacteraceae bacterium]|nr:transglycosylase [Caulobacteraceae bacterium]
MGRSGVAALLAVALLLDACATRSGPAPAPSSNAHPSPVEPPPLRPTPPASQPEPPTTVSPPAPPLVSAHNPANLPGWASEDHLAALHAWQAGCLVLNKPADKAACAAAQSIAVDDDAIARRFFENNFTV